MSEDGHHSNRHLNSGEIDPADLDNLLRLTGAKIDPLPTDEQDVSEKMRLLYGRVGVADRPPLDADELRRQLDIAESIIRDQQHHHDGMVEGMAVARRFDRRATPRSRNIPSPDIETTRPVAVVLALEDEPDIGEYFRLLGSPTGNRS